MVDGISDNVPLIAHIAVVWWHVSFGGHLVGKCGDAGVAVGKMWYTSTGLKVDK